MFFFYSELRNERNFKRKLNRKIQQHLPDKNFIRKETTEEGEKKDHVLSPSSILDAVDPSLKEYVYSFLTCSFAPVEDIKIRRQ